MDLLKILGTDGKGAQLAGIESSNELVKVVVKCVTIRGADLDSVRIENFKYS